MSFTNSRSDKPIRDAIDDWVNWQQRGARPTCYIGHEKYGTVLVEIVPSEAMTTARMESEHRPKPKSHKARS